MEDQKTLKASNFWFGFVLGIGIGLTGVSLLATKKGRKFLRNILELSENLEENLATIIEAVGEKIEEKKEEIVNEITKNSSKNNSSNLNHLLTKIKNRLTF